MKAWIGREMVQHDVLTPGPLARFRATLDSAETGVKAEQGIHWCLCLPEAATETLDSDGHPKRGGFLPPIALPRRMWASSAVEFHAPVHAGAKIERSSTIAAIEEKRGGTGPLVFVTIDHRTHADGLLVVSERQTIVYREATSAAAAPSGAGSPDLAAWQWHRALTPSRPLLFRYSALTFNSHRIHYDLPYAVDVEGYRGLVVHGPLTATLLLDLVGREIGHNRLKQFSFRGQSPAFAGEVLHLVATQADNAITLAALGSDGRIVMSAQGEAA
ncbi:MAG: MaoC family dehydratase N-terminal domain-containing protein [Sphingomonadales bacterium]|jgi:3-methylfumaryl-CoA hydratase|nr:MaoC family dehydratase N-terminal domain-containing protein [Sphingomonadales bacterium]MBK6721281.1 MaoC family dehydratase N-terminal domain-containing protein [Sphingomonadales bacterium]MBK8859694.1 MaoC family dehydratase N-terminal domain-containing protein [Sphingomonadales bacterium]